MWRGDGRGRARSRGVGHPRLPRMGPSPSRSGAGEGQRVPLRPARGHTPGADRHTPGGCSAGAAHRTRQVLSVCMEIAALLVPNPQGLCAGGCSSLCGWAGTPGHPVRLGSGSSAGSPRGPSESALTSGANPRRLCGPARCCGARRPPGAHTQGAVQAERAHPRRDARSPPRRRSLRTARPPRRVSPRQSEQGPPAGPHGPSERASAPVPPPPTPAAPARRDRAAVWPRPLAAPRPFSLQRAVKEPLQLHQQRTGRREPQPLPPDGSRVPPQESPQPQPGAGGARPASAPALSRGHGQPRGRISLSQNQRTNEQRPKRKPQTKSQTKHHP